MKFLVAFVWLFALVVVAGLMLPVGTFGEPRFGLTCAILAIVAAVIDDLLQRLWQGKLTTQGRNFFGGFFGAVVGTGILYVLVGPFPFLAFPMLGMIGGLGSAIAQNIYTAKLRSGA